MSSLILDYTNCLAEAIGATHGLTRPEVDTLVAKLPKHHESIDEMRANGESGFFDLPYQDLGPVRALIKKHQGRWSDLVLIATGGSALAPMSLIQALGHAFANDLDAKQRKGSPRVFTIGNPDPRRLADLLETIDLRKTLFLVASRSGCTAETNGTLLTILDLVRRKIGKAAITNQFVIATEKEKSPLADLARQEKIEIIPIPANVSGRFSVFAAHSLFLAGLHGLDIGALVDGAVAMDKRCRHGDASTNPAYMHSLIHYLLTRKRRKTIHAMFAFSDRLHAVAEWYNHLCSVSLGKMLNRKGKAVHVGPTPVTALGSFDQHGQMQLYAEGPFDKVTTFLRVRDHGREGSIPTAYPKLEAVACLAGVPFATLLDYGHLGAEQSVTASGRPNMSIILDQVDEGSVGGLYYMLELSTALSAELYGIDPFDQPGVENGKHATCAQLGRGGFEDLAKRLHDHRSMPRRSC